MTTEPRGSLRRSLVFAGGAAIVLASWTTILACLALTLPPGAPLAVFAPGHVLETVAQARGSFEGFGRSIAITRSTEPGLAHRLYAAGALLVIDARVVMSCRSLFSKT
jgi:hypothetical protein